MLFKTELTSNVNIKFKQKCKILKRIAISSPISRKVAREPSINNIHQLKINSEENRKQKYTYSKTIISSKTRSLTVGGYRTETLQNRSRGIKQTELL
jgi:hypothetical protein